MKIKSRHFTVVLLATSFLVVAGPAFAQSQGPLTPPAKKEVKRIPADVTTEAPPIPAEEIIKKFTAKEAESQKAFESSDYKFTLKVVEYDPDGSAVGDAQLVSRIYYKPDHLRYGGILEQPDPSLKRASFSLVDLQDLAAIQHFPLTPDKLEHYDITYIGPEKVDEITAFLFAVKPKRLERRERFFDGLVWVDDRDFEIVKTYGRFVSEVTREELFPMMEGYREVVNGVRLPTYVRADGYLKTKNAETKLRLTLRLEDFAPSPNAPKK
jgi:hypothetical protein